MRVAYIAHPIGGNVSENLKKITEIGRKINLEEPEVIPFAPYFFDCHCLNDDDPDERERGIKNDKHLLLSGIVDEVRLYGSKISKGMWNEILLARENNIPIIPATFQIKQDLQEIGFEY